jgi:oxygen-dependent protoporphyrinogen oxidase
LLAADRLSGSLMKRLRLPAPPSGGALAQPPAPVFWSLDGSTARLPAELAASVASRGVAVHTGVTVEALSRTPVRTSVHTPGEDADRRTWELTIAGASSSSVLGSTGSSERARTLAVDGVVLAVPAGQASRLLADLAPLASSILGDVRHSSVSVITLSIPSEAVRSDLVGTGFLVPRTSPVGGRKALVTGCTYLSRKWPGLARPGDELIRLSVGRYGDDRPDSMDDDELTAATFGELSHILDIAGSPNASLVTRWEGAFPQYEPGHPERIDRVEKAVSGLPGIGVAGNAYRGVGIPAVVGTGRAAAKAVLRSLEGVRRATPA